MLAVPGNARDPALALSASPWAVHGSSFNLWLSHAALHGSPSPLAHACGVSNLPQRLLNRSWSLLGRLEQGHKSPLPSQLQLDCSLLGSGPKQARIWPVIFLEHSCILWILH